MSLPTSSMVTDSLSRISNDSKHSLNSTETSEWYDPNQYILALEEEFQHSITTERHR
jgi:hypothetical protein